MDLNEKSPLVAEALERKNAKLAFYESKGLAHIDKLRETAAKLADESQESERAS